jgi:hypothetical protein
MQPRLNSRLNNAAFTPARQATARPHRYFRALETSHTSTHLSRVWMTYDAELFATAVRPHGHRVPGKAKGSQNPITYWPR